MVTQVSDWNDLNDIRNNLTEDYELVNDIDSSSAGYDTHASSTANSGNGWDPIGDTSNPFQGQFNGQGYTISDLYTDRGDNTGLFSLIQRNDEANRSISNLNLENFEVYGGFRVGCIAGANGTEDALNNQSVYQITECTVENSYVDGDGRVGGLIGIQAQKSISNSFFSGDVLGQTSVGGILGEGANATDIFNCIATGNIETGGSDSAIGGIVGDLSSASSSNMTIRDCYSNMDISAGDSNLIGGIAGTTGGGIIERCYVLNRVRGNEVVGGIVGGAASPFGSPDLESVYVSAVIEGIIDVGGLIGEGGNSITDAYWNVDVTNQNDAVGNGSPSTTNVEPLQDTDMLGDTASSTMTFFDFSTYWETVDESDIDAKRDSYPILQTLDRTEQLLTIDNAQFELSPNGLDADNSSPNLQRVRSVTSNVSDADSSSPTLFIPAILNVSASDADSSAQSLSFPRLESNWDFNRSFVGFEVEETRTWNSLTVVLRYESGVSQSDVNDLKSASEKVSIREVDSGGFRGIDLSNGDNTFNFNAPVDRQDVRSVDTWLLNDFEKTNLDREGNTLELEIDLIPKKEKSFDNEYGSFDFEPTQSRNSNEWLFDFTFGSIATSRVSVNTVETSEGTADVEEIDMILTPKQTRIFEENLGQINQSVIREVPDGRDFVDDTSDDNRNTVIVTQPDGADGPITDGVYTCLDWETEWISGAYQVTWEVARQESDADLTIGDSVEVTENGSLQEFSVDNRVVTLTADMIGAGGGAVNYEEQTDFGSFFTTYNGGSGGRLRAKFDASDVSVLGVQAGEAGVTSDDTSSGALGGIGFFDGGNGADGDDVGGAGGAGSGVLQFDGSSVAAVDGGGGAGGVDSSTGGGGGGGARGGSGARGAEDGGGVGEGGDGGSVESDGEDGGSEVLDASVLDEILSQQVGGGASDQSNGSIEITLR